MTLEDPDYAEGLLAYDDELYRFFDPIWQREYRKVNEAGHSEG